MLAVYDSSLYTPISAEKLTDHWAALDAFEGEAYERVLTTVTRKEGDSVVAFIYVLRKR